MHVNSLVNYIKLKDLFMSHTFQLGAQEFETLGFGIRKYSLGIFYIKGD